MGTLEADVLRSLKRLGRASAGEVADDLRSTQDLAYTTISTTLDRLYKKGFLGRETVLRERGPKHIYAYSENPDLQRRLVNKAVDKLVRAFGPSIVSTIYDRLDEVSPDETKKLKEMIYKKRRSSR